MASYFISYDLVNPGQNYPAVHKAIESMGTYNHVLKSAYLLKCNLSIVDVENNITMVLDRNDRLIVCRTTGTVGGYLKTDEWPSIHSNFDC